MFDGILLQTQTMPARPRLRDTTRTRRLLMSVGFLGTGLVGWGVVAGLALMAAGRFDEFASLTMAIRCGLGAIAAGVGFGLAQIANDVRYRIVPAMRAGAPCGQDVFARGHAPETVRAH